MVWQGIIEAVAAPLTSLLSPKVPFVWTEMCQLAFDNLKALLVTAPVLSAPDFSRPFKLVVDASDAGVGAVLLQDDSLGVEHSFCYFSKKIQFTSEALLYHREGSFGPNSCSATFQCVCFFQPDPSGLHRS